MINPIFFIILIYKPDIQKIKKSLSLLNGNIVVLVNNSEEIEITENLRMIVFKKNLLISNPKNLGYTGGMNVGLKYAFGEGAEWVVLLNDDVELSKEGIEKLCEVLNHQEPGIVGPYGGSLDSNRWTTIFTKKPSKEVDYISGSFMAIHRKVYELTEGFYPDYFMYYEDADICVQAKKAGYPLVKVDLPNIHHEEGSSIERGSVLHEYYLARNHLLFVERQAPMRIKLREFIRLPKTIWEHKFFMNRGGLRGVIDFLFLRYGKARI